MTNGFISQARKNANKSSSTMPPMAVLDKIADESITGKFNCRKSNMCPNCFTARSSNGTCSC